jgi:hypothetical protein
LDQRNATIHSTSTASLIVTSSSTTLSLSKESETNNKNKNNNDNDWIQSNLLAAFFLSPAVTESALHDIQATRISNKSRCCCTTTTNPPGLLFHVESDEDATHQLSRRLLTMVHPFLAENFAIRGIISLAEQEQQNNNSNNNNNIIKAQQRHHHRPADIVMWDLSHTLPLRSCSLPLLHRDDRRLQENAASR